MQDVGIRVGAPVEKYVGKRGGKGVGEYVGECVEEVVGEERVGRNSTSEGSWNSNSGLRCARFFASDALAYLLVTRSPLTSNSDSIIDRIGAPFYVTSSRNDRATRALFFKRGPPTATDLAKTFLPWKLVSEAFLACMRIL